MGGRRLQGVHSGRGEAGSPDLLRRRARHAQKRRLGLDASHASFPQALPPPALFCNFLSILCTTPPTTRTSSMLFRATARSLSSQARQFSSSAARQSKVTVLGAGGGIGQPLSLLLKLNPLVTELSLYDIRGAPGVAADVSHVDTHSTVRCLLVSVPATCRLTSHLSRSTATPQTSSTKPLRVRMLSSFPLVFLARYACFLPPAKVLMSDGALRSSSLV